MKENHGLERSPSSLKILLIVIKHHLWYASSTDQKFFVKIKGPKGWERPRDPPSIFEGVEKSLIPSVALSRRTTKRSSNDVRTHLEDELPQFTVSDEISHEISARDLSSHEFYNTPVGSYHSSMNFWAQSVEFFSGIPKFSVKMKTDLTFEAFHTVIQLTVPSLSENRFRKLD